MGIRASQCVAHLLLAAGVVLLAASGLALVDRSLSSRLSLQAFDSARAVEPAIRDARAERPRADDYVDFSLWSEKRVREYQTSLSVEKQLPLAVVSISKLRIRAPVFEGTSDLILNRGVGWITGTARPGEAGNTGIAGHRDGFFRGLRDIVVGDTVELTTLQETGRYVVDEIEIVTPERVEVLQPRGSPSLTLVTCYPFYFVGDAPQRFIVHAALQRRVTADPPAATGR
jgi:sortase A